MQDTLFFLFFLQKLIILLCCTTICLASHHTHIIPVEGYESKLQDLGEHLDYHETPVRVVKITKTIAVKVPVPYPVKVVEKVPYPVHVNKPYPVPVPHIVKVPASHKSNYGQEAATIGYHGNQFHGSQHDSNSYQVQEDPHDISTTGELYDSNIQSYGGGNNGYNYGASDGEQNLGGSYYAQPSEHINGISDEQNGHNSFKPIQNYFKNLRSHENLGDSEGYH